MSQKVITPVGTSLFTNYMQEPDNIEIDNEYDIIKDLSVSEWEDCLIPHIKSIRSKATAWAKKKLNRTPPEIDVSAEITSLVKIQEEVNDDLEVYLIATETVVSRLAAEILQDLLHDRTFPNGRAVQARFMPDKDVIEGLQVTDNDRFQNAGLTNLFDRIKEITHEFRDDAILNITGGFKGVIPYLTMIGQVYQIPQCYIFEETENDKKNLLHIPQLPFQLDWGIAERYYPYLRKNAEWLNHADVAIKQELKKRGLIELTSSGEPSLSSIGKVYQTFIDKQFHLSPSLFGHYVEYKVLEYFLNFPYQNYAPVKRGVRWPSEKNELDIVMGNYREPTHDFIVMQIKSYGTIVCNFEKKVKGQIQRNLKEFERIARVPKEFHLCIHYQCGDERGKQGVKDALKPQLQELSQEFENMPDCLFKVSFLHVNLGYDAKKPKSNYQAFMERALSENAIEEYLLEG